jgi:hypothetical protein
MTTYDDHKNQKLRFVPGTNKRLGVDHHGDIDFFWRTNSRGEYVGERLATLRALSHESTFLLQLQSGEHAGVEYRNASYDALLAIVLLAYDAR